MAEYNSVITQIYDYAGIQTKPRASPGGVRGVRTNPPFQTEVTLDILPFHEKKIPSFLSSKDDFVKSHNNCNLCMLFFNSMLTSKVIWVTSGSDINVTEMFLLLRFMCFGQRSGWKRRGKREVSQNPDRLQSIECV